MANTKPFVQAALICEQVLQEKDGVLTAVRIIDRITTEALPKNLPANLEPSVGFSVLVGLKSGNLRGTSRVAIKLRRPSGGERDVSEFEIQLNGEEHGANILSTIRLAVKEFGVYWFDVYWNGGLLTSIPLRLVEGSAVAAPDTQSPANARA